MPTVIDLSNQFTEELARQDAQAMNRLIRAYRASFDLLSDKLELLLNDIGEEGLTSTQLMRMRRYQALMAQVAEELRDLQGLTRTELEAMARVGVDLGGRHATGLIAATIGDERIAAGFNRLPSEAIRQLLGFLDPGGELYRRLGELSAFGAERISEALVNAITLGYNSRKTAQIFSTAFGASLTDALRMVRTAQNWAYREANRATYIANSDVVVGWIWNASLDATTCASCWAMHGTFHELTETLNDHYNGRCSMVPVVKGFDPVITEGGEAAFQRLSEAEQRQILGPGKYDAWKSGSFEFSALTREQEDAVYGMMRSETSLKELIGEP